MKNNTSSTPRTDAFYSAAGRTNFPENLVDHARQIERELNEALDALQKLRDADFPGGDRYETASQIADQFLTKHNR